MPHPSSPPRPHPLISALPSTNPWPRSSGELLYGEPGYGHLYLPDRTWLYLLVHGAGCFWAFVYVRHAQHATVAGVVASWYFRKDTEAAHHASAGCCFVFATLRRAVGRHSGSLAFGSLLITLLQLVRLLTSLVLKRLSACAGDSSVAKLACCCASCCLGCVDRSVRYLSRNAYVLMMVEGTPFCTSAVEAFSLLTKHMVKVALVRSIGAAFLLLGKLFVAAASAGTGALLLLTHEAYAERLFSIVPAVVAIFVGAWLVVSSFMCVPRTQPPSRSHVAAATPGPGPGGRAALEERQAVEAADSRRAAPRPRRRPHRSAPALAPPLRSVYNMAMDTIFLSFTLDLERARHGAPPHCDPSLQALIDEHPSLEMPRGYDSPPGPTREISYPGGLVEPQAAPVRTSLSF